MQAETNINILLEYRLIFISLNIIYDFVRIKKYNLIVKHLIIVLYINHFIVNKDIPARKKLKYNFSLIFIYYLINFIDEISNLFK